MCSKLFPLWPEIFGTDICAELALAILRPISIGRIMAFNQKTSKKEDAMNSAISSLAKELLREGDEWRLPLSTLAGFSKRARTAKKEDDLSRVIIPLIERIKVSIRRSHLSEHQKEVSILSLNEKKNKYLNWLRGG
jgi:hypothetical protein